MSEPSAPGGDNGAVNTPETFVWRETFSQPFTGSRNFTWTTAGEYGAQIEWVFTPAPGTHGGGTLNIRCGVGEKRQHLLGHPGKLSSTQLGPPGTWQLDFEVANGYRGDIEVTPDEHLMPLDPTEDWAVGGFGASSVSRL